MPLIVWYSELKYVKNHQYKFKCKLGDKLEGKIIETHPYGRFLTKNLQWSDVGVYKFSKISEDKKFEINKKEVFGKCVIIDDVLITASHNILTEK